MRRFLIPILFAALLLPCGRVPASPDVTPEAKRVLSEAEAKAAFILNFARFTEWPEGKLSARPSDPIRIAVLDKGPVTNEIRRMSENFHIQGHPVEVVVLKDLSDVVSFQVAYLDNLNQDEFRKYVETWKGQNLLVVGGRPETAKWGAAVAFKPMESRLQFIVNRRAAHDCGLTFSSQLLKLASKILD
jgi:hypothetical protein